MTPTNEEVAQSLERILKSPLFKNAERQSRFLRHVVEKHLNGEDNSLREMAIGLEVYDRRETYDPKEDPIVRVEASRLRARLREYYETADPSDHVRIDIPKGSYVPSFEWRRDRPVPAPTPVTAPTLEPSSLPGVAPEQWAGSERRFNPQRSTSKQHPPTRSRWMPAAAAVVLIITLLSALGITKWRRPSAGPAKFDSIAVLPFSDLSEKQDLAHLTEALTEQIQDELTRNRDLRVVGSTSSKQAALNPDLRAAAKQVGVRALIQGSIRAEDQKLRVTVRLFDGDTGSAIWAESFDGSRDKLLDMEQMVASAVAGKFSSPDGDRQASATAPADPKRAQAVDFYQQARALAARESAGPMDEEYRLYQLAITIDPSYAAAHAGLASVLIESQGSPGGPDSKRTALAEAQRAIALDPGLPQARATLILYYRDADLDWAKARDLCTDSLQRFPNSAPILVMCSSVEGILLHRTREVELMRRAVTVDPLSPRMHGGLMFALYQNGQFDEALKEADIAISKGPSSGFLYRHKALILGAKGDPGAGLKVIEDARAHFEGVPADWQPVKGYLLGLQGKHEEAQKLLQEYSRAGAPAMHIAIIYLGMGERTKALTYFEKSLAEDPADLTHAIPEYYMRKLDGEPRFEAIKRKLGIVN